MVRTPLAAVAIAATGKVALILVITGDHALPLRVRHFMLIILVGRAPREVACASGNRRRRCSSSTGERRMKALFKIRQVGPALTSAPPISQKGLTRSHASA